MCSLCIASLRGPPIGGQENDRVSYLCSTPYTLCLFEAFPSRGNEKIGGTGYCVTYDTESQSRNVLASPLGEEGHEVAKGCTRVRMIMILDVDVTAEGGIIKLIALRAIPPPFEPFEPSEPCEPSHRRCVQRRSRVGGGERSEPITRMLIMPYDTESQSRNADFISIARKGNPPPSARRAVKLKNLKNLFPLWYCVPPSPRRRWDNHRGLKAPSNLRTLRPRGRSILRTFPSEPGPRSGPIMPPLNPFIHFSNDV